MPESGTPDSTRGKPLLVILSGPPATGKTTLARRLAPALGLFLLTKDAIKETLGDALPARTLAESRALGGATFRLLYHLATQLIDSDVGVLLEGAFYRGTAEPKLRPLVTRANAVLIHYYASQEVSVERYRERNERGERHPVHFDKEQRFAVGGIAPDAWDSLAQPLDLGIPTLVLDTTEGYVTELAPILGFVHEAHCKP